MGTYYNLVQFQLPKNTTTYYILLLLSLKHSQNIMLNFCIFYQISQIFVQFSPCFCFAFFSENNYNVIAFIENHFQGIRKICEAYVLQNITNYYTIKTRRKI